MNGLAPRPWARLKACPEATEGAGPLSSREKEYYQIAEQSVKGGIFSIFDWPANFQEAGTPKSLPGAWPPTPPQELTGP
jgi:hypothetical protein